ncbi:MAG: VCBS repeat-containing protein, partial [Acidobacteria bacterium]|nr:VCBS repeat-containing protein [Acidobacteriota bacterium]
MPRFFICLAWALPLLRAQCPLLTLQTPVEMQLRDTQNSFASILLRESDGSFTQVRHNAVAPYNRLSNIANATASQFQCTRLMTRGTALFTGPRMKMQLGVKSTNPIVTDLRADGTYYVAVGGAGTSLDLYRFDAGSVASSPVSYQLSDPVESIAEGDFNGDGKRDLVVVHKTSPGFNPGRISVLLGNGDGTMQPPKTTVVGGTGLQYVTVYDFNGDGRTDLLTVTSRVLVELVSNGDGSFQSPVGITSYVGSSAVVGDVNGDGIPDIVTGLNRIVLLGQLASIPMYFDAIALGDLNRDGKADLAALDTFRGVVGVFVGHGDGYFSPVSYTAVRRGHTNLMITDFDRDGTLDVVLGSGHPDAVMSTASQQHATVLIGLGDGTLYGPEAYVTSNIAYGMTSGDFNGDGRLDLVGFTQS